MSDSDSEAEQESQYLDPKKLPNYIDPKVRGPWAAMITVPAGFCPLLAAQV